MKHVLLTDKNGSKARVDLETFLKKRKGCQFVSVITKTTPKLRANTYGTITKLSCRNGLINVNYQDTVARRMAEKYGLKKDDIQPVAGKSSYVKVEGPILAKKSDENVKYLQLFPQHKAKSMYIDANGHEIDEETIASFLPNTTASNEFKPVVISIGLENIVAMKCDGVSLVDENLVDSIDMSVYYEKTKESKK